MKLKINLILFLLVSSVYSISIFAQSIVTSVTVPSDDTYISGENLDFTVNWDENVTVVTTGGTPSIPITLGTVTVQADYVSGSGTSALLFSYAVSSGDEDTDGIAVGAS
ncbi:MAG: hypothetical protein PF450_13075, partial [Bacteroidales bacterium]|nr:hypothetical protein [Bacteroidales bacterium]